MLDFDSEEEFTTFFFKTRTEILETFRKATDVRIYSCVNLENCPSIYFKTFILFLILGRSIRYLHVRREMVSYSVATISSRIVVKRANILHFVITTLFTMGGHG